MTTLKIQNQTLVVFQITDVPLFESSEVSTLLGYKQASSLRKQTLTDWKEVFEAGIHYVLVHDETLLRRYEQEHQDAGSGVLAAVKPTRGRLFFTPGGMLKVLNRTSKPSEELRSTLLREGYFKNIHEPMVVKDEVASKKILEPTRSKEDRMFEYDVMQKLLEQLERLENPQLRDLAISAAEVALGRELTDLRFGEGIAVLFERVRAPKTSKAPEQSAPFDVGPLFTKEDYYSMTKIGEMAGGFSATIAGKAADTVAARSQYTHDQIRNEDLPINQVIMRPDSSTGKKRPMVRFSMMFANQVVVELRTNPKFEATLTRGIPTLPEFAARSNEVVPLLSRGPFDEDSN